MPTLTLANLETAVLDRLDGNSLLYTTPEVDSDLNDAIRVLNLFTGFNQQSVQVPGFTVINQFLYAVPSPILFPLRVYFNRRQLWKTSLRKLSYTNPNWLRETSAMGLPVQHWVPMGISTLAIHPADSAGGQELLVSGIAEPTKLVNPGDTITVEDEYAECIVELAADTLQIKEGGKIFADSTALYLKFLSKMREKKRWRSQVNPRYFVKVEKQREAEEVEAA